MQMETKSIAIFGMGIIAGYLLTNYFKSMQPVATTTAPNDRLSYCEQEWEKQAQLIKVVDIQMEAFKRNYINECMNPTPITATITAGETIGGV